MQKQTKQHTAQAIALIKQLKVLGLDLTLPNGKQMGHVHALNVIARMQNFQAHSHKVSVQRKAKKTPAVASVNANPPVPQTFSLRDIVGDVLSQGLQSKYFPFEDWQYEANQGDTSLGYADWLVNRLETLDESDADPKANEYANKVFLSLVNIACAGDYVRDTEKAIRVYDRTGSAVSWNFELNCFDRWGELNGYNREHKVSFGMMAAQLSPQSMQLLQDSLCDEMCFIGTRSGVVGLFVEFEYRTVETEAEDETCMELLTNAIAVPHLRKLVVDANTMPQFIGVEFGLANIEDYSPCERHAVLAFVPLSLLESQSDPSDYMAKLCAYTWDTFDVIPSDLLSTD